MNKGLGVLQRYKLGLLLILFPAVLAVGQEREDILVAKVYKGSQGRTMPYRLYVPQNDDKRKRYPLVLYLHVCHRLWKSSRMRLALLSWSFRPSSSPYAVIEHRNSELLILFPGDNRC